jgi:hypothetical protein
MMGGGRRQAGVNPNCCAWPAYGFLITGIGFRNYGGVIMRICLNVVKNQVFGIAQGLPWWGIWGRQVGANRRCAGANIWGVVMALIADVVSRNWVELSC